jgi:hypothetical protein
LERHSAVSIALAQKDSGILAWNNIARLASTGV